MKLKDFLDANCKELIDKMNVDFDSHEFINQLIINHEVEYVKQLYSCLEIKGIFRAVHSQIGKYLSENQDELSILKLDRHKSDNIKDYESENQKWRRKL
jgi:hypothetical protein